MVRALAADRCVCDRQARKWLAGDGAAKPKGEIEFFVELMDHFDDDWRRMVSAFDDYCRGKIFYGGRS